MIHLVWRTDVHLSDVSPASRTDAWVDTVFGKLDQVKLVANKVGAAAVLDGGDFFHIKSPSRNSHDLVRRTAEHHEGYTCPVYCTPGNHDSVYGDYAFLGQQPLGVLYASKVFQRLYDNLEVYFGPSAQDTSKVQEYPFDRNTGVWAKGNPFESKKATGSSMPVVRVVGVPYHGVRYDMARFSGLVKGEEDYLVCVGHVLASAQGGSMFEGEDILRYEDLAPLAPDIYLFGHWHKDQGVQAVDGTQFVNLGSLTRGALSQDEVSRQPSIALLSFTATEATVRPVRLNVLPAKEVFDMGTREREEARTMTVDAFVESVRESLVEQRPESMEAAIKDLGHVPESVRERALLYWERS